MNFPPLPASCLGSSIRCRDPSAETGSMFSKQNWNGARWGGAGPPCSPRTLWVLLVGRLCLPACWLPPAQTPSGNGHPCGPSLRVKMSPSWAPVLRLLTLAGELPLNYSCPIVPTMDRGAWRLTVHGVTKSQTWLNNTHTDTHTQSPPHAHEYSQPHSSHLPKGGSSLLSITWPMDKQICSLSIQRNIFQP